MLSSPLAIIGDPHFSSSGVSTRIDDYAEASLRKVRYLTDAISPNTQVIFTGDIFTTNTNSNEYLNQILLLLRQLKEKTGLTPLTVLGNHDTRFTRPLLNQTQVGILINAGVLELFTNSPDSPIVAFHAYEDWDQYPSSSSALILIAHAFQNNPPPGETLFLPAPSKLREKYPSLRLVFNGHDHMPRDPVTHDGLIFYQPGSLMRNSISHLDFDHHPCFYLVSLNLKVQTVYIDCPPASEVFDASSRTLREDREEVIGKVIASFSRDFSSSSVNLRNIISESFNRLRPSLTPFQGAQLSEDIQTLGV